MNQRLHLCLILLSFVTNNLLSQGEGHFMRFGLGYSYQSVLDQSMSPVSYSGHFGHIKIGYHDQNERWLSEVDINAALGLQKPDVNQEESNSQTLSSLVRLRYSLLRKWGDWGDWRVLAGLSSLNRLDFRSHNQYVNSQVNYTSIFALGPAAGLQREFALFHENWGVQVFMDLPLAAYYLRPGYIKPFFNDQLGSKGFVGWGNYFQLNTRSDLIYYLGNGNQLRLSYDWEYTSLKPLNKVQTGTHQISVCAVFKF